MSESSCHNLPDKEITASEFEIMSKPCSQILADDTHTAMQNKDIKVVRYLLHKNVKVKSF